jgi:hypothetical protein
MAKVNLTSVPTKSLLNLVIFGGGILLFLLLAILPAQKESKALDARIAEISAQIKEEQILTPLYESLLRKTQIEPPNGLDVVPLEKLKRGETDGLGQTFLALATRSNLQLTEYSLEIESMLRETGNLSVSVLLKGEFLNLQPFLLEICRLPYLDKIEEITIKPAGDTQEFRLRFSLARE